ncbi:MAG: alkaline phosphatase [Bacteroidota bacterium]
MKRRDFFKNGALATAGLGMLGACSQVSNSKNSSSKKAKNIIFCVSDGMSTGTLTMADSLKHKKFGNSSNWLNLYRENRVSRSLMDMASASSIVTDSAAASSSWGGGHRIPNGGINIGRNKEKHYPIWPKFMKAGKKAGVVTSVPVTHATPAGFCVNSASRNDQEGIAEKYADLELDVILGGGQKYFDPNLRSDQKDMYRVFKSKGYQIATSKSEMNSAKDKKILGVFDEDALAYRLDRINDKTLSKNTPSLAEMSQKAIDVLSTNESGFVLQIEGGKVDWAAHANDAGAMLYDQIDFDEAVKTAIDFAEKDGETLVIITTDHGNANPGILYGKNADENFDRLQHFKQSNDWILQGIDSSYKVEQVRERIEFANTVAPSKDDAKQILDYYNNLEKQETGVYNYRKLPFSLLADIQREYHSVGWISMNHSGDFVELAMFGPGSENLPGFIKNTDLHYFMLAAAAVEDPAK